MKVKFNFKIWQWIFLAILTLISTMNTLVNYNIGTTMFSVTLGMLLGSVIVWYVVFFVFINSWCLSVWLFKKFVHRKHEDSSKLS